MNKKNYIRIISLCLLICTICGCNMQENATSYFSKLESNSSVIVRGKCGQRELLSTSDKKDNAFSSISQTSLSVEKVFKNTLDIDVGSEISILEEELYKLDSSEENTYYKEGYAAMITDHEYILFLEYSESKKLYVPVKYGKIPIDKEEYIYSRNEKEPTKQSDKEQEFQKKIAEMTRKKYK